MKTKVLISFVVTAKLICDFVFAYAKSRFSHNQAQLKQLSSVTLSFESPETLLVDFFLVTVSGHIFHFI